MSVCESAANTTSATCQTRAPCQTCPTCETRPTLLIFQRLHERSTHRGLGGPDRRNERRGENRRHERRHRGERKPVVEVHPGDVLLDDLQQVEECDRAEREAEREPQRADADRLE